MANYLIRSCDENSEFVIDGGVALLVPTSTYYFEFTGETNSMCYTVISLTEDPATEGINVANKYDDCLICLQDNNFSFFVTANTIYNACVICCPCESGETITSVAVPHPTFTDLYGNPVIQGNAVLIGGNGLNS